MSKTEYSSHDRIPRGAPIKPSTLTVREARDIHTSGVMSPYTIRQIRLKMGLSQTDFASLFGVSCRSVLEWEKGRITPRRAVVARLWELLDKAWPKPRKPRKPERKKK